MLRRKSQIRVALPKGRLMAPTAALLEEAGWGLDGYREGARLYRLQSRRLPDLTGKIFHERDIPIQVAIGNYDLGICGSDWVEELLAKYPSSAVFKVADLGYKDGALYLAGSPGGIDTVAAARAAPGTVRLASEYPNLAESFALKHRLRRFSIFPLWGAAEVYPPETADLSLVSATDDELDRYGLVPVSRVLTVGAVLIANRGKWASQDMSGVVSLLNEVVSTPPPLPETPVIRGERREQAPAAKDVVRLALPDGHQQAPTSRLLTAAGISIDDYPSPAGNRRPTANPPWLAVKVIRPQDMPLQVANGNFDLAITGRDWLTEHLCQFPSSPVTELADLKQGRVSLVAVVSGGLPVDDAGALARYGAAQGAPLRVASEYVHTADRYAREHHLGRYRVVPTWGASEAFIPEDADLLIENTETGRTIAQHNLKIIDTLAESTACLIGRTIAATDRQQRARIGDIVERLRRAAGGSEK